MGIKSPITLAALILLAYLPVAIYMDRTHVSSRPQGRIVVQLTGPFTHIDGHAYQANPLPGESERLRGFAADPAVEGGHSKIKVYEGRSALSEGDNFGDVSRTSGRYAFWERSGIVISSSDASDPNQNHRTYWAVVP